MSIIQIYFLFQQQVKACKCQISFNISEIYIYVLLVLVIALNILMVSSIGGIILSALHEDRIITHLPQVSGMTTVHFTNILFFCVILLSTLIVKIFGVFLSAVFSGKFISLEQTWFTVVLLPGSH